MQRRFITVVVLIVVSTLWLVILLDPARVQAVQIPNLATLETPTASTAPQPTPTTNIQSTSGNVNTAIPVALIGAGGAIIAALIAAGVVIYQTRRKVPTDAQKSISRRTRTSRKPVRSYRDLLRADPRITTLQILDMSHPLTVTSVYVRLRLHREARTSFELDPELLAAEARRDPNTLLQAGRRRLESKASTALDPSKAIQTYKHCVIVGDPGAGKTTLLKYLALKSARKQLTGLPDLPIHIELNDFASSEYDDLLDFAANKWDERYGIPENKAREYMEENLEAGRALLLLDALDETVIGATTEFAENSYRFVSNAIMQVATRYHQSSIVVTARKAGYQQRAPLTGFTELEVLDFSLQDIRQFVRKWFAGYDNPRKRANAEDLQFRLEHNPRIQSLAANPLLLSLIVIVYEAQLDLPDRRAELYKQCVETLLTKWDASRDIRRRREFKPEHKRQLLAEVAWHFHTEGRRYFPENELLTVIASFLPVVGLQTEQNRQVLDEIAAENGLLKEQAQAWYGFLHLTLQEYFVAQHAVDQNKLDTLLLHRGDPWWEEVILLYCGQTSDASPLLRRLLGLDGDIPLQEDFFHTNLILAGQCLAARPVVREVTLREEIPSCLLNTLKGSHFSMTGQQIAEILIEIGGTRINLGLIGMISDQQIDSNVRERIARAIGKSDEHLLATQLVPLLSSQQIDQKVRKGVTVALSKLGERSLASVLLPLLTNQQIDTDVRESVAVALGELGDNSLIPDLLRMISNSQIDWKVRRRIVWALDDDSVISDLLALLYNIDIDLPIRWSIAQAIGELGERSLARDLVPLLSNPQIDSFVRAGIANALSYLSNRSIVPNLLQLLSRPQLDSFVRGHIAQTLGRLDEHSVVPELLKLLLNKQEDFILQRFITIALSTLDDRSIIPELLSLLSNPQLDHLLHVHIAITLCSLGERSAAHDLILSLSDTQYDHLVNRNFVEVLGDLDKRPGSSEVLQEFSDYETKCAFRVEIAGILGDLGDNSIVPDLLQLLSDAQIETPIVQRITKVLGNLGDNSIVPDLLQLLSNSQLEIDLRRDITNTIGKLADDESTTRTLAELIKTSDVADDIHQALWRVSHRAGVRVFISDSPAGKQIEIVKWGNEPQTKDLPTEN